MVLCYLNLRKLRHCLILNGSHLTGTADALYTILFIFSIVLSPFNQHLSVYLPTCVSIYPPTCVCTYVCTYICIYHLSDVC